MRKTGNYYLNSFIPDPLPPANPPLILNREILELFGEASYQLGQLNKIVKKLPDPKRFINAYVIKEALLSSEIEGIHTTLIDVFTQPQDGHKHTKETQLVLNYIKSLEVAQDLIKNENLPIVSRVILAAHKALMEGEGDKSSPGQYRKQSVRVGEFTPPPASEIAAHMSALEKYINEDIDLPPLIKAGLAHVQFETIHPFLDGNGRIGRLLIVLMFISSGLLNEPILYPSYYFKKNSMEYYLRLNLVRTDGDFEGWISFYLKAIRDNCIEACHRTEIIEIHEQMLKAWIDEDPRFSKIRDTTHTVLNSLFRTPVFGIKQISNATGKSYNTVSSIMTHFIDLRWVTVTDEKKRNKIYQFDAYLQLLEKDLPETKSNTQDSTGGTMTVLGLEEVSYTKVCIDLLQKENKLIKLSNQLIKKYDRKLLTIKDRSLMFEARVAANYISLDLETEYEYKTGVGNTDIDFKVQGKNIWLVEVVSIVESDSVKKNITLFSNGIAQSELQSMPRKVEQRADQSDDEYKSYLDQRKQDFKNSLEKEFELVQRKIGEKVFKKEVAIKFPEINGNNSFHIILVDMRSYNCGQADIYDYKQLALGAARIPDDYILNGENNQALLGFFEEGYPLKAARYIQERIHLIGFVNEKKYTEGEICKITKFAANPHLFSTSDQMNKLQQQIKEDFGEQADLIMANE